MARGVGLGLVAGAVGTIALDMTTYGDMVARARPSSGTPAKMAGVLADKAGIDLSGGEGQEAAQNRQQGIGALLGYMTGVGVGVIYGALDRGKRRWPVPLAGVALGLAAMAASDLPIALTGVSDPREWSVSDWISDLVPHLIYGFATATAYAAFRD
jgi:drug/metabolite transporter (DMT)-like permease